ncbi:hypothetical protein ACWF95_23530 [Streptomyces vinaceus]
MLAKSLAKRSAYAAVVCASLLALASPAVAAPRTETPASDSGDSPATAAQPENGYWIVNDTDYPMALGQRTENGKSVDDITQNPGTRLPPDRVTYPEACQNGCNYITFGGEFGEYPQKIIPAHEKAYFAVIAKRGSKYTTDDTKITYKMGTGENIEIHADLLWSWGTGNTARAQHYDHSECKVVGEFGITKCKAEASGGKGPGEETVFTISKNTAS